MGAFHLKHALIFQPGAGHVAVGQEVALGIHQAAYMFEHLVNIDNPGIQNIIGAQHAIN